jgi:phosphoribosylanthranilate isomerase
MSSVEEARKVVTLFSSNSSFSLGSEHVPMMGFQVSYKSLKYGFSEGNNRVPRLADLPAILECVSGSVFPTLHYYTKEPEKLVGELDTLLKSENIYEKGLVGGVQINGVWPKTGQMSEIRSKFPGLKIILQMSSVVTGDMTVPQVADKLAKDYAGVEYIILDSSHGKGIEFDTAEITSIYQTFRNGGVQSAIVFAGGFNGDNVKEKLVQLIKAANTSNFSIDAEGGLRDKVGEGYGNDILNLDKVRSYLKGASEILRR